MSSAVAWPQIPGFQWVRPLGQGGFDVFLYRQELPSRTTAHQVVRAKGTSRHPRAAPRADAMTLLAGHPSVVELHGVGTTSDGRLPGDGVLLGCGPADAGARAA